MLHNFVRSRRQHFNRALLPEPFDFYRNQLHKFHTSGKWAKAICPFHEDHTPSLSINIETGSYRCFGCGAHGGGVIDFYMQIHGADFKTAAKALGAWRIE